MTPIVFSSDSSMAAAAIIQEDGKWVRLWNVENGVERSKIGPLAGDPVACTFVEFNQQLVTVCWVDPMQAPIFTTMDWVDSHETSEPIFGGLLKSVEHANRIAIETWDVATGKRIQGVMGPHIEQSFEPKGSIDLSGRFFSWTPKFIQPPGNAGRHQVQIVDLKDGKSIFTLAGHSKLIHGLKFSPDSKRLATWGDDGVCILWNTFSGEEVYRLTKLSDAILTEDFSSEGKKLATSGRGSRSV